MPTPSLMYKPRSITNARSRRRLLLGAAVAVPPFCTLFIAVWAFRAPLPAPEQTSLQIANSSESSASRTPLNAAAFDVVLWHTPPPSPEPEPQPEPTPVLAAAPPPPPPPPPPAIQLLAILTRAVDRDQSAAPDHRTAIAYDPDVDEIRTLRPGDALDDGWSVASVTHDTLTLSHDRRTAALVLDQEQSSAAPTIPHRRRR